MTLAGMIIELLYPVAVFLLMFISGVFATIGCLVYHKQIKRWLQLIPSRVMKIIDVMFFWILDVMFGKKEK